MYSLTEAEIWTQTYYVITTRLVDKIMYNRDFISNKEGFRTQHLLLHCLNLNEVGFKASTFKYISTDLIKRCSKV